MIKNVKLGLVLLAATGSITTANAAGNNLFPVGDFNWNADACEVRTETQNGLKSCALFLKEQEGAKKKFIFFYRDQKKGAGDFAIGLDTAERYRDAKVSVKFDFPQIIPKMLYRASFLIPPVKIDPAKTYCATIYVKGAAPGQKLAVSLMGDYKNAEGQKKMIYKFYDGNTSLMWEPLTVELALKIRPDAVSAEITSLVIDVKSPGSFRIGKIEIYEKNDVSKQ